LKILYFIRDLQKQNTFLVYTGYALCIFYFIGLSLRKAAADDRGSSYFLLNETMFQSGTDEFRNRPTENLLLLLLLLLPSTKKRRIEEFIVLMMRP